MQKEFIKFVTRDEVTWFVDPSEVCAIVDAEAYTEDGLTHVVCVHTTNISPIEDVVTVNNLPVNNATEAVIIMSSQPLKL